MKLLSLIEYCMSTRTTAFRSLVFLALLCRSALALEPDHPLNVKAREALGLSGGTVKALTVPAARPSTGRATIAIQLGEEMAELELAELSLRSAQFMVQIDDGTGHLKKTAVPPPNTMRGHVRGKPNSSVSASIRKGQLQASIRLEDGTGWVVEPLRKHVPEAQASDHIIYRPKDILPGPGKCGGAIGLQPKQAIQAKAQAATSSAKAASNPSSSECPRIAQIAFDADFEYFQLNGSSVEQTVDDIESVLNGVDALYVRDLGIGYEITRIIVRATASDPYTGSNGTNLLHQLRDHWNDHHSDVPRDMAHLMTGRNISGIEIGLSFRGQVCVPFGQPYGWSLSRVPDSFEKRITLTAHELAHNWGACHCDSSDCNDFVPIDCDIMHSALQANPKNQFEVMTKNTILQHLALFGGCIEDRRIYVNGTVLLPGNGSETFPFKTVKEATDRVLPRGCVIIKGPLTYDESLTADRASTLFAVGGPVEIGKK